MERNQLLDLLKPLSDKNERKRLIDFIRSPYFNLSEKVQEQVALLHAAWAWYDEGHIHYWNEEQVFHQIFGEQEPYNKGKFDQFKSRLVQLVCRFFAEETRLKQQHPLELLRWEMQYYRKRELFHRFELAEKEGRKILADPARPSSIDDLLHAYLFENEVAWLSPGENHRRDENYLFDAVRALDRFWFAARARWTSILQNQNQVYAISLHKFKQAFTRFVQETHPEPQILVEAYREASQLQEDFDDPMERFEHFQNYIRSITDKITPEYIDELEALLGNFCIRQINKGKFEFLPKHFEVMQERLISKRIYKNGKLLGSDFLAIVRIALKMPRTIVSLNWLKDFLESHRNKLYNQESAEEMVRYLYACYYFEIGDFPKTLKNLKETYRDINFKIASKILEIKTMYETDHDEVDNRIDATYRFFNRDKLIPDPKRPLLTRFCLAVRKLRSSDTRNDAGKLKRFIEELQKEPAAELVWLLDKANELLLLPGNRRQ